VKHSPRLDNNDIDDQHSELGFYDCSSLKQQPTDRLVAPLKQQPTDRLVAPLALDVKQNSLLTWRKTTTTAHLT
jgi:hypothetical protein